ncbi:DUF6783 domain-containing protein [uncultured Robinsoniella sp.]|uniref:DUF6783 domain-containing protein n=1 Tax=Robinsoniella sp. TaxID=2496533 RepID=UPI00374E9CA4
MEFNHSFCYNTGKLGCYCSDRTIHTRACLKIHSCHLHAPVCGIFAPNSGYIARYAPFIRDKSPTNWDAQLPESNFKTRSSAARLQAVKTN